MSEEIQTGNKEGWTSSTVVLFILITTAFPFMGIILCAYGLTTKHDKITGIGIGILAIISWILWTILYLKGW